MTEEAKKPGGQGGAFAREEAGTVRGGRGLLGFTECWGTGRW